MNKMSPVSYFEVAYRAHFMFYIVTTIEIIYTDLITSI